MKVHSSISKPSLWTGRILKGILSLFLAVDAVMKVIKHPRYVEGTKSLGLPESIVQPLGIYLLIGTILFMWPRTMVLGGLLLTAYLGGAVAITIGAMNDDHPYVFPLVFAILIWVTTYLMKEKVRAVIPFQK